jgi:hypothetical protein
MSRYRAASFYGERITLDNERASDNGRISRIRCPPNVVADDDRRRRSSVIVVHREWASCQNTYSQRLEIAPGNVFGAERYGSSFVACPAHSVTRTACLKGCDFLERRYLGLQNFV